jgi:hypothetical protein
MLKVYPETRHSRPSATPESTFTPGPIVRYGLGVSSRYRVKIVGPIIDKAVPENARAGYEA